MKLHLLRISEHFAENWHKHVFQDDTHNYFICSLNLLEEDTHNYFICSLNLLEEDKNYEIDFTKARDLSEQSSMFPKGHYFEIEDINTVAKEVKE